MRLISWNVNGVRAATKKGLMEYLDSENPDILCLQETKAEESQGRALPFPEDYHQFWNSAKRKGYSGVAVLTKEEPEEVTFGLGQEELDNEGRVIILRFPDFYLVNVYTPNAQAELKRLDYRVNQWDVAFRERLAELQQDRPVIFCGDLNVAHKEIDLANPKTNRKNPGFSDEERESFTKLLDVGFVDTFREFEPGPHHYSWWSFRSAARERNIGWRIDYFGASEALKPRLKSAFIRPEVHGSDHCPVGLDLA